MNNKDNDEKFIYDKLSKINVTNTNIKKNTMDILKCKKENKNKAFLVPILTVFVSLFLVVGVSASIIKNSEWFMSKFNPNFKNIVEPIDLSSEDNGIRVEFIAGQKYGNDTIAYFSIQDISGKNRITENTELQDGLRVFMDKAEGSYAANYEMIYFDKDTNTIYFELNLNTDSKDELNENLNLSISKIYFDSIEYEDELIEIDKKYVTDKEGIYLEESKIWSTSNLHDTSEKVLEADRYFDMPHKDKYQQISSIGLIDNKLHIQVVSEFNQGFGPSSPYFKLENTSGEIMDYEYKITFVTDKNNNIIDVDKINSDLDGYKYQEFVFPIVNKQDTYKVYYNGSIYYGTEGKWSIKTNICETSDSILSIDKEIIVGNSKVEKLTLSPLALGLYLSYNDNLEKDIEIELKTDNDLIKLESEGFIKNSIDSTTNINYKFNKPISIKDINSIIINSVEITVK